MQITAARQTAVQTLMRISKSASWSSLTISTAIEKTGLSGGSAAFYTALVYGVLERRITLDACINAHSKIPIKKLQPAVAAILRVAVYQLLYMDKTNDAFAVNESVGLTKAMANDKAAGFVNAVLWGFVREGKTVPLPDNEYDRLSIQYSMPVPLISLWREAYGEEITAALLKAGITPAPTYLRVNTLKTTTEALVALLADCGTEAQPVPEVPGCLKLLSPGAPHKLEAYNRGLFYAQDISSQLCAAALDAQPGMRVLDVCAAPGGKSFLLAQAMENSGGIIACDLHSHRVKLIEKGAARLGIDIITAKRADMLKTHDLGLFDRVLCDVPCSGYGTIRHKPEIKYKPPGDFASLPETQYKLLRNASQYCKGGGLLLYSTCTLSPQENEDVTEAFLRANPAFAPYPLPEILGGKPNVTLTTQFDGDGFYMALMKRGGAAQD